MELENTFKIMIVDDHPVFCLGMTELIGREPDLTVSTSEDTADKAWTAIKHHCPDLVIVDISLKESNGIDLVEDINREYPDLPVLVLSMYDETLYAERALMAGARGYIMKQKAISHVVKAIRQVLSGEIYASQKIKDKIFSRLVSRKTAGEKISLDILTNRELEVFRLIGDGLDSKEIAARLNLSIKTIGTHRENIKTKLNLKHYTELVKSAVHWSRKMEK
ncbi:MULTISPECIES: response regulator transcription factor [Desulfobacula]|uniref:Two component system repsonse regulator, LuxR family n=2 Tax=Desulfobacula TaxID=28222 RepID=K0NIP3_DESTT|nr:MULTISPECIES: response regulator transcription factor [Desulfobacula]CCK79678.1 two component system repsonse regulator, LuxR family [Desulfobacula toluolica Tol2]SDU34834.1 two component transcriptional regulator, LuxR family [Desulfobacula phenolica]